MICASAFSLCSSIICLNVGDNVETIASEAFFGCSSLKHITIPNSVKTIGKEAFAWCKGLTGVIIGNGVNEICPGAFCGCNISTLVSHPTIPPRIKANKEFGDFKNLIVQKGCEKAYMNSDWAVLLNM